MKQLWIALGLLAALFSATIANSLCLRSFTGEVSSLLIQAEERWEAGDQEEALTLTRQAEAKWKSRSLYLHTTLRHSDIDPVDLLFQQTLALLQSQEGGEYAASNAALLGQLKLVWEQEQLDFQNLL